MPVRPPFDLFVRSLIHLTAWVSNHLFVSLSLSLLLWPVVCPFAGVPILSAPLSSCLHILLFACLLRFSNWLSLSTSVFIHVFLCSTSRSLCCLSIHILVFSKVCSYIHFLLLSHFSICPWICLSVVWLVTSFSTSLILTFGISDFASNQPILQNNSIMGQLHNDILL